MYSSVPHPADNNFTEEHNRLDLDEHGIIFMPQRSEAIEYINIQRSHESHGYQDPKEEKR